MSCLKFDITIFFLIIQADEGEMGVRRFMREVVTQWRSLSMEVRSVRSMLEEVLFNWDKYTSMVASLQAWLEVAEKNLNKNKIIKKVFYQYFLSKKKKKRQRSILHFVAKQNLSRHR